MPTAETARLIASLELQDKNFTRGIKRVESGVTRVDKKLGAFSGFVNRNMARAIDSIGVRLIGSVGTGLEELATLEDAATSVTGAIGQVGKGWTTTADDIIAAANRIESETDAAFDDKLIVAATETLIRYGKVSEKNLVPAMEVMTDLAARTGDVDSAATLLAKALADPAKAAGKLARQGIVLTKAQQDQIKAMVEAGDTAGAQTLLLQELEKTTKGAAAASAGPYRDALNKLGDAGEDLRRGFTTALAPALIEVADLLTNELAKPSTIKTLKDIGSSVAAAVRGVVGFARGLPWETIGESLRIAGQGAKAVLDAFLGLPSWVQAAVISGWGLNKITGGALSGLLSGVIKGVLGMTAAVVNINAATVNGLPGGVGGAAGKGGGLLGGAGKLALGLTGVGIAAALASEFEDEIQGLSDHLAQGWRDALKNATGVAIPKISPSQLEWPFGPKNTPTILPEVFGGNGLLGGTAAAPAPVRGGDRPSPGNPGLVKGQLKEAVSAGTAGVTSAVQNAQSIASRENSAQKAELGNVKNAVATMDANQRAAAVAAAATTVLQGALQAGRDALQRVSTAQAGTTAATASRSAGQNVALAMATAASRIVGAVNALDLSVNVTTVQRTTTVNNRYGPSGGSATTDRVGGGWR
jgi:hypothetical protein